MELPRETPKPETTMEIREPMPYDKVCAECGEPVALVLTIRDWTGNHNGYPTDHLLCAKCANRWSLELCRLLHAL